MQLETGLTLLASVGSIAPFVGLFGLFLSGFEIHLIWLFLKEPLHV